MNDLHTASERDVLVGVVRLMIDLTQRTTTIISESVGHRLSGNAAVQAMAILATEPSVTSRRLAERCSLSRRRVNDLVNALIAEGLAERSRSLDDGRVRTISPTPSGRLVIGDMFSRVGDVYADVRPHAKSALADIDAVCAILDTAPRHAVGLVELISATALLGRRLHDEYRQREEHGPYRRELLALLTIDDMPVARPTTLADELGLSSGGMTYVLDQLEHDGLVDRAHNVVADRRAIVVTLDDAGRDVVHHFYEAVAALTPELRDLVASIVHADDALD